MRLMSFARLLGSATFSCFVATVYAQAQEQQLRAGQAVVGAQQSECSSSFLADNVVALCNLIPGASCQNSSWCKTYTRQIFTGTSLDAATPGKGKGQWNGMGGSGQLMADALICSLRDLAPQLKGPIRTPPVNVDLGLGVFSVVQEVGFKEFDRVVPRVVGYRKITVTMPVVGKAEAIAQTFTVTKRSFTVPSGTLYAGNRPIRTLVAVDVATEEKHRQLAISPPAINVATPLGVVAVMPKFSYATSTSVATSPFNAKNLDIPKFLGSSHTVRLSDIYGTDAGAAASSKDVEPGTFGYHRTGWSSQLGLGTRGTHIAKGVWAAPASGPILRPDLNPYSARSSAEAQPSVDISAQATIKYPKSPKDLLPSWVFALNLSHVEAYVTVTPKLETSVAGEFVVLSSEGSNHEETKEFHFKSTRLATSSLVAGLRTAGSFSIDVRLRILVEANFPIVGSVSLIDIDAPIPVPLYKNSAASNVFLGSATSTGDELPESLDQLISLHGSKLTGAAATSAYLKQCLAPGNQPPPNQPAAEQPQAAKPADLFADSVLWPCNICIASKAVVKDGKQIEPQHFGTAMPSAGALPSGHWKCDLPSKSGCMDMCKWNKVSGALTIAQGPKEIAASLPAGNKTKTVMNGCYMGVVK